jgi:hypothetical protein
MMTASAEALLPASWVAGLIQERSESGLIRLPGWMTVIEPDLYDRVSE